MTVLSTVKRTLSLRRDVLLLLVLLTLSVSMLSLVIPVGVQTIVNTLAFSIYSQPIFILTGIIVVVLLLAGLVRICQMVLLENAQQEIFVRFALLIAKHLPRLKIRLLENHRGPELINRFFEIVLIQKNLAIIMIYLIEVVVQSLTGMLLLALYHPYLLVLDILLMVGFVIALLLPMRKALESAYQESDHKHYVAAWLEEYLHCPMTVKFANQNQFALSKVDGHLQHYLAARQSHFRSIIKHFIGFYGIYMFSNAALLGVGGWLVVKQQLSLGQFVASEIVLNTVVTSFLRLAYYVGDLYALAASSRKIDSVFQLEYDPEVDGNRHLPQTDDSKAYQISFENVCYDGRSGQVLIDNLSFEIARGEIIGLVDDNHQNRAKGALIDILVGINHESSGSIRIDGKVLKNEDKLLMRQSACLVNDIEIFPTTLMENIRMRQQGVSHQEIHHLLELLGLRETIETLPEGLESPVLSHRRFFTGHELYKLCICRALVTKPKLLILDRIVDALIDQDIKEIMRAIQSLPVTPTTIIGTNDPAHLPLIPRLVSL